MSDPQLVKLCAEAMGADQIGKPDKYGVTARVPGIGMCLWNPLKDDAQAMAMVKKFGASIENTDSGAWRVIEREHDVIVVNGNLNRAIVECVAKMQKEKTR